MDHLLQRWAVKSPGRFQHLFLPEDPQEAYDALLGLHVNGHTGVRHHAIQPGEYDHGRLADLVANEGFSHHPQHGSAPSSGYMASYDAPEGSGIAQVHHINELSAHHIAEHRDLVSHHLSQPSSFQGGWHDTSTGNVYLDASRHFDHKPHALDFAAHQQQKAIFNLDNFSEHFLHPKQDPLAMKDHDAWKQRYADTGTEPHSGFHSYAHRYPFTDEQKSFWGDRGEHVARRDGNQMAGRPVGPWRSERYVERQLHEQKWPL